MTIRAHGAPRTDGLALPRHLSGEGLLLVAPVDAVLLEEEPVTPPVFEKRIAHLERDATYWGWILPDEIVEMTIAKPS